MENKFLDIDNTKISYLRCGSGEPVLLIHGITTYSFIWRKIIPILSKSFDVIAIDLVGCGDSDKPLDVSYSIKSHSERIVKIIESLNLQNVHLVGHDVGGGIAQILAANHEHLFSDLTLINTVAYDFWPVQPIITMRTPIIRQLAMASLDIGAFRIVVKRGLHQKDKLTDELMDLFWAPMRTNLGRKAFLHMAKCLDNNDLMSITDKINKISIPVLVIRGDGDVYLSAEISEKLCRNIKDTQYVKIPDSGHFMMEEVPSEISMNLVAHFKKYLNV
jgi:pimeloyl-ACP methyl ester carboxylesterase